ncbi:MAG: alpha/beta hydrolase family protein [Geminicoccaceae bacterium]
MPFAYSVDGNAWNAGAIENVPLNRTVEVMGALRELELSSGKLALYGISRGAEHALLVASLTAAETLAGQPDAVAVHAAPDVVCGAFDAKNWRDPGDPGWRSWDPARRAWTWHGCSEALKPSTPIEIERYTGSLLLTAGTEDKVWDVAMTRRLEARLRDAGREPEVHYYRGEGHILVAEGQNHHNRILLAFLERCIGGISIIRLDESERTRRAEVLLRGLLRDYELAPFLFTRRVQIGHGLIPRSHPVLTLNTRHIDQPDRFLSLFLHEQMHWFVAERPDRLEQAMAALRALWPELPNDPQQAASSPASTNLHLGINWLEWRALASLVGEDRARQVIATQDIYPWIYDQVLSRSDEIASVMAAAGLTPAVPVPPVHPDLPRPASNSEHGL